MGMDQPTEELQRFDRCRLLQLALQRRRLHRRRFVLPQRPPDPIPMRCQPQRSTEPSSLRLVSFTALSTRSLQSQLPSTSGTCSNSK